MDYDLWKTTDTKHEQLVILDDWIDEQIMGYTTAELAILVENYDEAEDWDVDSIYEDARRLFENEYRALNEERNWDDDG